MNTDNRNQEMYTEDMELQENNSNVGKRLAVGAAVLVGGAAVAGGAAAYAASTSDETEVEPEVTAEDLFNAAGAGSDYEEPAPQPAPQPAPAPAPAPEPEPEPEPEVVWEESQRVYVDGELAYQSESGTAGGHNFMFVDADGDNYADAFAYDQNQNGQYEENEVITLTREDGIQMGHETQETSNHYFTTGDNGELLPGDPGDQGNDVGGDSGRGMIHNNFEDEKTGENYSDDFAQNNPDYNNDYYNRGYHASADLDNAGEHDTADVHNDIEPDYTASAEPDYADSADYSADADTSDMGYTADAEIDASFETNDSMDMGGEDFLA